MTYRPRYANEETDLLFKAILTLKDEEACYRFFEDICTVGEVHAMAQRFTIAKLLSEEHTYQYIEEKTGASTATISRINRFLKYGPGGYAAAISSIASPKNQE